MCKLRLIKQIFNKKYLISGSSEIIIRSTKIEVEMRYLLLLMKTKKNCF